MLPPVSLVRGSLQLPVEIGKSRAPQIAGVKWVTQTSIATHYSTTGSGSAKKSEPDLPRPRNRRRPPGARGRRGRSQASAMTSSGCSASSWFGSSRGISDSPLALPLAFPALEMQRFKLRHGRVQAFKNERGLVRRQVAILQ